MFSSSSFSFSFSFQHGLTQQRRVTGEGCIRHRDVSLSVLVRKTHLLRHLILEMIISPRQARDKHTENSKQRCVFRRLQMNGMKGSDSDILQSNVDGLSASGGAAPNQSSVSRAARLLFTAPTCGVCVYDPVYACAYYGCCCCSAASLACASALVYSFSSFSVVFGSVRFRFRFRFSMA